MSDWRAWFDRLAGSEEERYQAFKARMRRDLFAEILESLGAEPKRSTICQLDGCSRADCDSSIECRELKV